MSKLNGFISLISAGVIFGSFGVLIRFLSKELTTFQQIGLRNLIGLIITVILMRINKVSLRSFPRNKLKFLLLFGMVLPISVIFFVLAIISTKMILAIFAFYIGSIFSSLILGLIIFNEKFTLQKIVSLGLVIIGLIFFVLPTGIRNLNIGILFALISGILDTLTNSIRKHLSNKVNSLALTSIPLLGGLIMMTVLIPISGQSLTPTISGFAWFIALIFGFFLFAVNYLTTIGFRNFDLNLGTIVISSELFFTSLFGFIFFQEIPLKNELFGGIFVILAVVATNIKFISLGKKRV